MNQIARIDTGTAMTMATLSPRQLDTIKRTLAKDTNDTEFDLFIEYCKVKRLDPFSRQAIAVVFNKDKADKRQMTIITTQDGLRVMAARCGNYRPAEEEPVYEYDPALRGQTNPLGIVKCTTKLWQQDPKSAAWHPVIGVAYWDEYAPIKTDNGAYEWVDTGETYEDSGRPKKRRQLKKGVDLAACQVLDPSGLWPKMPRNQIAKCATCQALRAGWPETFSGVYGEEEMDRAVVADRTASELVAMEQEERRAKAIGMSTDEYPFVDALGALHFIAAGKYGDVLLEDARMCKTAAAADAMIQRNREGFNRFWAKHKNDALTVKHDLESIIAKLPKAA